jgi:CRP-like cAMP-binding protein
LLDKGPRTATIVTQGPVEALVLGPREFAGLLDEVPSISHKLLKAMAERIRELDTKAFG